MSGTVPAWADRFQEVLDGRKVGHKRLAAMIKDRNGGVTPPGGSAENLRAYRKGLVRNPRPAVIRLVSQELGVRYEWLMDGEGPMTAAEARASQLAQQYGEGLHGAWMDLGIIRFLGGEYKTQAPVVWDAEAIIPAYFLTWRRLVQLRSPALSDDEIRKVGSKLLEHLIEFLDTAKQLNGSQPRSAKWHTDVALAWLSAVAVTATWDRVEGD